jgi:hypothetical protein
MIEGSPGFVTYSIEINTGTVGQDGSIEPPSIVSERIQFENTPISWFEAAQPNGTSEGLTLKLKGKTVANPNSEDGLFPNHRSIMDSIFEMAEDPDKEAAIALTKMLRNEMLMMRNFDWDPVIMRDSVLPGYTSIGSRGEGLASVLHHIFQAPNLKATFLDWLQALTPLDAVGFEFMPEGSGKLALLIAEGNGHKVSAASASDGTLRFLAMLAAYFSAPSDSLYFLEELENGIHPTRLHLLLQLIEQRAQSSLVQTIATTHSPELLRLLSEESLQHASLIYRLDDRPDAQIQRIADISHFQDVLEGSDLGDLQESGWLENTMSFQRNQVAVE